MYEKWLLREITMLRIYSGMEMGCWLKINKNIIWFRSICATVLWGNVRAHAWRQSSRTKKMDTALNDPIILNNRMFKAIPID